MFNPIFESVLNEKGVTRAFVDLSDLSNPLWETFEISVVPTVLIFKEGKPVFRRDGVLGHGLSRSDLQEIVGHMTKGSVVA